ncbi:MAG: C4-type zinc ribbon domain-containing protein [Candidatus Krumholzibacteria bacterium]|jgi:hypothetical protein|nr:C4-type zinc ribbon domain-containing protein [Candidatus Krumholzibacteria bacterium]MDP6669799.1 C4-type zinc ribbon domain-containing protein [Candidatus Krumholzibacteria bacterium]MDP6796206.1 C4-type zinc ribbon domain-containing protein [Candidatus Krumholzibacteria bacterium]MDP7022552.1 C4-type zinc ribbon domain-containing protein [Candidatus Krumholzibacteria bacterium]
MDHHLLPLYLVDQALQRLEKRVLEYPKSRAAILADQMRLKAEESRRLEEIEELSMNIRMMERDSNSNRSRVRELQAKEKMILSLEASRALSKEMKLLEEKEEELESFLMESMETLERMEREGQLRQGRLEDEKSELREELHRQERGQQETLEDQKRISVERERILESLELSLRRRYSRIYSGLSWTAIASLVNSSCGGCGQRLTPQDVLNIREHGEVMVCESCGRLIIKGDS